MRKRIPVTGSVYSQGKWSDVTIVLDGASEINVISQRFAVEHQLMPYQGDLPQAQWLAKQHAYRYGAYLVTYKITDNWNRTKQVESLYYAYEMTAQSMLLGIPDLYHHGIAVDYGAETWRWGFDTPAFQLQEHEDFARTLVDEPLVYAIMVSNTFATTQGESVEKASVEIPSLSARLS